MNKLQKIFIVFVCVVLIGVLIFISLYNRVFLLDFTLIETVKNDTIPQITSRPIWLSIRDEKYCGFYDTEYFSDYGIDVDKLDLNNYTYIVTFGYKLNSISYSPRKCNYTSGLFLREYTGIVDLDDNFNFEIYVYQIKKMNIDCGSDLTDDVLTFNGKSFDTHKENVLGY